MWTSLKGTTLEVFRAIAPLIGAVIALQFTLVGANGGAFIGFLVGAVMVVGGMVLFLIGIEYGVLPAGKAVGSGLVQSRSLWLIIAVAFLIGFATTIAEPDVIVLSKQAESMDPGALPEGLVLYIIGIGLAFFTAMAMLRIVAGFPIAYLFTVSYVIVIGLSLFTPAEFVPLAFDAGSATTGVLAAPIIIALGIGLSSVLAGRSAISDGFGLLGLASTGAILAVLVMGLIVR
jgi:hypothetical protein